MADFGTGGHGPYPDDWSDAAREFWDSEPANFRELYSLPEWEALQEAFEGGWLATPNKPYRFSVSNDYYMTKQWHDEYRQDYYEISGTVESSFDWEGYREYLHSIGS